ncbi:MAG: cbb3-type cytochrome c oxidase subunit 3 [Pseudomonadota bacterium]|nr:CcoQ/FixQ family Cbb3-type cytochrome c oxidase assembly chaperone [Pseudomonadales bacterium]MDY6918798.1 cbb3-type cytochrome c oxidase subunit 3 [Pseudomonadota bacterium]
MDINTWRGIATVLAFAAFIGVCIWTFSAHRKKKFEEAANLPFADEDEAKHENTLRHDDQGHGDRQ